MVAVASRRLAVGAPTRSQRHEIERNRARRRRRRVLAAVGALIGGSIALALLDAAIDLPLAKSEGMLLHVRADSVRSTWFLELPVLGLDLDGDGRDEIAAGVSDCAFDGHQRLSAWSHDGGTIAETDVDDVRATLRFLPSSQPWNLSAGDSDADGREEVLLPFSRPPVILAPGMGRREVPLAPLELVQGALAGEDLDGDGADDLVLVAHVGFDVDGDGAADRPREPSGGSWIPRVHVLSGRTLEPYSQAQEELVATGWAVRSGSELQVHHGLLVQLSGRTLREIRRKAVESVGSLAAEPRLDVDGDGLAEIIVAGRSRAEVLSGVDLAQSSVAEFRGAESVAAAGDLDRDGRMDFAVVEGMARGRWRVTLRGSRGSELVLFDGTDPELVGCEVRPFGDLDQDGIADIAVVAIAALESDGIPWHWKCPRNSRIAVWSGDWSGRTLAR